MAGCKLTKSLENKNCKYAVAGASAIYLANYYPMVEKGENLNNAIAYTKDADGYISKISLPKGEKFFKIKGSEGTLKSTDVLLAGGNGGKYRQHGINAILNQNDIDIINEGDALSLGKFIAVVVGKDGVIKVLGRTGGLEAPAGGFDYDSGAAEADATGWTVVLQGSSVEIAPLVKDISVINPIYEEGVIVP